MTGDRIFGFVILAVALAFIASATQIETSFLADPVGPKAFPIGIGIVAALAALAMIIRPDPDPDWPALATFGALAIATVTLIIYAFLLRPLGFLIPTAIVASIISFQIFPRFKTAMITGPCLAVGLFLIFRYALGLGLSPLPKALLGN